MLKESILKHLPYPVCFYKDDVHMQLHISIMPRFLFNQFQYFGFLHVSWQNRF